MLSHSLLPMQWEHVIWSSDSLTEHCREPIIESQWKVVLATTIDLTAITSAGTTTTTTTTTTHLREKSLLNFSSRELNLIKDSYGEEILLWRLSTIWVCWLSRGGTGWTWLDSAQTGPAAADNHRDQKINETQHTLLARTRNIARPQKSGCFWLDGRSRVSQGANLWRLTFSENSYVQRFFFKWYSGHNDNE